MSDTTKADFKDDKAGPDTTKNHGGVFSKDSKDSKDNSDNKGDKATEKKVNDAEKATQANRERPGHRAERTADGTEQRLQSRPGVTENSPSTGSPVASEDAGTERDPRALGRSNEQLARQLDK